MMNNIGEELAFRAEYNLGIQDMDMQPQLVDDPQLGVVAASYEQPMPSYEQPMPSYEQPMPTYEQPIPSYEQPMPTYEPPIPTYEQPSCAYDDLFPALPNSNASAHKNVNVPKVQYNSQMRVGTSVVTQVFRVPYEERKFDNSDNFGEKESLRTCLMITNETGAQIETSTSKDGSLSFLVTGRQSAVLDARRRILSQFQKQASKQISIPREHYGCILGKQGQKLRELEKQTATKINVPGIAENGDLITITGTKEGIEKAEHDIRVCSDEQSRKAFERVSVPKAYHPFIVGPNGETVGALAAETGARINIPPPSVLNDEIVIAGEKEGVMTAKARVQAIYDDMLKKCTTVSVEVPRTQHKYVVGVRGATIQEILRETGVSVEMPPADSDIGTLTLRGPQDKLGLALTKVCEKANSVKATAVIAPPWIHKYIIGKKGANIRKITQDLDKVHVEFVDDKIKIEGPPPQVEQAQAELEKVVREYCDKLTFADLSVDPKFFKHIIGKSGANVNRLKDELGVHINIGENDTSNVIRIEGNREGVAAAQKELGEMVFKLENEREKDVIIDRNFFKSLIGPKGEKIKEIREKFNRVLIAFPDQSEKRDVVKLRGPHEDIDRCHKYLLKIVKELGDQETQEVPIFKQFHKFVIGKGGANIRKIRDETQTKIDLPAEGDENDVIRVTGKKERVEEAVRMIQSIHREHANIVTEEVVIPPKFYNFLIGAGGKLVHSVKEECGGVAIKFPSPESESDRVVIKGPAEDVERARRLLLELSSERQLASQTAEVRAKPQHHKFLIGKNGANVKRIRDRTGARIVFPSENDADPEAISIIGRAEAVAEARALLEAAAREIDDVAEGEVTVAARHHRHFVARRADVARRISDNCGGVLISFPRQGVDSERVTLKGPRDCIEAAKRRILEIVEDLESQVSIECAIPRRHHRTVMGAKGRKVQDVTSRFDVQIKFPERDAALEEAARPEADAAEEPAAGPGDVIRITGRSDNCQAAKQALLDLVPISVEMTVPADLHRFIARQRRRNLMQQFDVHILLPLPEENSDIIKITGAPVNIEEAKVAIEDCLKELEAEKEDRILRSFELQVEVDPEHHPKVIGKGGAVITQIRSTHGVQIGFKKKGDPEESLITVQGYEKDALAARDEILRIVDKLNSLTREELRIDARVHSRLIGARGRNIRRIMDECKADVRFPRAGDDPDVVVVVGEEAAAAEARDRLLNLAEEYVQDLDDADAGAGHRPQAPSLADFGPPSLAGAGRAPPASPPPPAPSEFVVRGAPWERRAPDTASTHEFPSIGRGPQPPPAAPAAAPAAPSSWGPRANR